MAKSKPRNRQRNSATKQPKVPSDPELAALRERQILPVIKHLLNSDSKIRSSAVQSICNLIKDEKTRKLLLREQIVKLLFEHFLSDSNLETRTYGWKILSKLAEEEDTDFCVYLFRQNILVGLQAAIETIIQNIISCDSATSKLPQDRLDLLWDFTNSILLFLRLLSESRDEILESVSILPTVLEFLFGLLDLVSTSPQIQLSILFCLVSLTDENRPIVQQIVESEDWFQTLITIKDSAQSKAIAACGILHNIFETLQWFDHNTPKEGVTDAILIPELAQFLKEHLSEKSDVDTQPGLDEAIQLAFGTILSISANLVVAFGKRKPSKKDLVSDSAADIEDNDEMHLDEVSDKGDSDINDDMEMVTGNASDDDEPPTKEATLESLIHVAAPTILEIFQPQVKGLDGISRSSLDALNNIAWTMSSIEFSSNNLARLHQAWASLAQKIWNSVIGPALRCDEADFEFLSIILSLAWAVTLSVKGQIKLQPHEHQKFMALYKASRNFKQPVPETAKNSEKEIDPFQGLGVKCLGVLGTLARAPASVELNREIGNYLTSVLLTCSDAPPADVVQALDQIFEIYSDSSYPFDEPNFWCGNIYKVLEDALPKVKKISKAIDKRKQPELRARADEAHINLHRFLVYKRKEKATKNNNRK